MSGSATVESDHSEFIEVDPTGRYGRYNEVLGKGASKTVYRAFDEYEGIEVAWNQVKLYDFLQSPEDLGTLYSEIHLLKTLRHSNIMKFYTSWVDTASRNINFVTEMFTSGTLRQYRQKHKRVNIRAIKHWCRQILRGLLYLHSHDPPVIHRDLKCDNIFVNGNQGQVKIGDLGLAAILRKSRAARCVGTPEFMAPEVYAEEYNELVDIYSFGMCVLEMVTLEYPYSECSHPAEIYKKVISGKKPESLYKVKDPEVRRFVEKCLATVSLRLPASELIEDPFLSTGFKEFGSRPVDYCRDFDGVSSVFRDPPSKSYLRKRSLVNFHFNYHDHEPERGLDFNLLDFDRHELDLFGSQEDKHFDGVDINIKGRRREDGYIFLRLRIADKEGRVRNIYFPFDVKADTAMNVATEMVSELEIVDQDATKIADMIDGEVSSLVPEWKSGLPSCKDNLFHGDNVFRESCAPSLSSHALSNMPSARSVRCSRHSCAAAIHGRLEEIAYRSDASEQCITEGAPVGLIQSDGTELYPDIWPRPDGPELVSSDYQSSDYQSCGEEEEEEEEPLSDGSVSEKDHKRIVSTGRHCPELLWRGCSAKVAAQVYFCYSNAVDP